MFVTPEDPRRLQVGWQEPSPMLGFVKCRDLELNSFRVRSEVRGTREGWFYAAFVPSNPTTQELHNFLLFSWCGLWVDGNVHS
jgi:hypothetical protein